MVYDVGSWRLGDDGCIHRRGRLKYSNGDVYDGEWVDGKRHGKGLLTIANGSSYLGEFEANLYHGFGLLTIRKTQHPLTKRWRAGETYEGEFVHGRKHGRGTERSYTGDRYDGSFVDGYYHGQGVCSYANGDVYDGEWVHGKWLGQGELRLANGSQYVGAFVNNLYHGYGRLLLGSGGKNGSYVGDFQFGKRHGKGQRVFGDLDKKYEGEWEEDEMHGVGVLHCGSFRLVGKFVRGKAQGHAAMSFTNGDAYEGDFLDGHFSGHGMYAYNDGGSYEGEFQDSKRHGRGRRVFQNGDVYDGEWHQDLMHGRGVLTCSPNKAIVHGGHGSAVLVYNGQFENGVQTGDAVISYAYKPELQDNQEVFEWTHEYEFPLESGFWHSGCGTSKYTGHVLRGRFHGHGVLTSPDGKRWSGNWVHGQMTGEGKRIYQPLEYEQIRSLDQIESFELRQRQFLLRVGASRVVRYAGEFDCNVRHGHGEMLYENGNRVIGSFVKGFAHGIARYRFPGTGKVRFAEFVRGERRRWLTDEEEDEILSREREQEEAENKDMSRRKEIVSALMLPA